MKTWMMVIMIFCAIYIQSFHSVFAFEVGIGPGEGRKIYAAKIDLKLHEKPSVDSLIIKGLKIPKGQKIDFIETIYRTTKPGLVKVLNSFSSTVRSYGFIDFLSRDDYYHKGTTKSIDLKSGDTVEYLQNRAEGSGFIRINDEILAFDLLLYEYQKKIEITSKPVTELWIRVVDEKKKPLGWVLINEKTVELLDVEF